ncbi:MAG: hypothetical protein PVF65_04810 [Sphingomonadales bacterium]|jgi:hypothetical protein
MMLGWLQEKFIRANEKASGENCDYLRDFAKGSRSGLWKFGLTLPMVAHHKTVPKDLWHLARIAATQTEDCGPCLQTAVSFAQKDKIDSALLKAALGQQNGANLTPLQDAAVALGRFVANGPQISDDQRQLLEQELGAAGIAELVATSAAVRIFPALKRGLGYSKTCSLVEVKIDAT